MMVTTKEFPGLMLTMDLSLLIWMVMEAYLPRKSSFIAQQTAENDTDLEALSTLYDTNKDGVLNSDDEKFDDILIFQDKNQDGSSDAGEIFSLDELGINEISVVSDNRQQVLSDGSVIHGQATYSKIDGTEGVIGDVGLAYSENSSQAGKSSAVEDSNTYENEPIVEINQSCL